MGQPISIELSDLIKELNFTFEKTLGNSSILKTIQCRERGIKIVKLFMKQQLDLSRFKTLNEQLMAVGNVLAFSSLIETERAGYCIREYVHGNLYDRISTRPFLTLLEKKWLSFQILRGVSAFHALNIYHGDLKTENILITSWNWVLIADFAAYKPVFLPDDNPATFSLYFDSSGRRSCYIAPERFLSSGDSLFQPKDVSLTPQMDMFALGCTLAELFLEGSSIFNLSQLLSYRKGQYSPLECLKGITDVNVREMITEMICLDPIDRILAQNCLQKWRGTVFPDGFYDYVYDFNRSFSSPETPKSIPHCHVYMSLNPNLLIMDTDARVLQLYNSFSDIANVCDIKITLNSQESSSIFPLMLDIPNFTGNQLSHPQSNEDLCLIFTTLVTSSIRNCLVPSSKLKAIEMISVFGTVLQDVYKLDRIVPFLIGLLNDSYDPVRIKALYALTQTLSKVDSITAIDVNIFPEYILPALKPFATDQNPCIRAAYARSISLLAESSLLFLEMSEAIKDDPTFVDLENPLAQLTYDTKLKDLQDQIQEDVVSLLLDSTTMVKQALLSDMAQLCIFFGKQKSNDFLISHIITYLNDSDWTLRSAFCEAVVGIGTFVGEQSIEQFILPLLLMALNDPEELVVEKALSTVASLAELGLIRKHKMKQLASIIAPLVCHPSHWIRMGAIGFMSTLGKVLPMIDVQCIIIPMLKPFLKYETVVLDDTNLINNLKAPLRRDLFDYTVEYAQKYTRAGRVGLVADKEFDLLADLESKGMTPEDKEKLLGLKYFISKSGKVGLSDKHQWDIDKELRVSLQEKNVIPHTVFLGTPTTPGINEGLTVPVPRMRSNSSVIDLTADLQRLRVSTISKKLEDVQDFGKVIDGQEHHIRELLEQKSIELSSPTSKNLGTRVHSRFSKPLTNWTPKGTLIAHFTEHRGPVNAIKTSPDEKIFVSCSNDGSVKVWDTFRLQTNVTNRARVTYSGHGASVKDVEFLEGRNSVASTSTKGSIHISRIEYTRTPSGSARYSPLDNVDRIQLQDDYATKLSHFEHEYSSVLVYMTHKGLMEAVDIRSMNKIWSFKTPPHHGYLTAMAVDKNHNWITLGTNRGVVTLWDVRFQVSLTSWQHISQRAISQMERYPFATSGGSSSSLNRSMCMAVENSVNEISVWDLESGVCRQVWCTVNESVDSQKWIDEHYAKGLKAMPIPSSMMMRQSVSTIDDTIARGVSRTYFSLSPSLPLMVSGGTSRRLCYNDLQAPEKSFAFSSPDTSSTFVYSTYQHQGIQFNIEQTSRNQYLSQNFARVGAKNEKDQNRIEIPSCHLDSITAIETTMFPAPMIISGSRDGIINVYR